MDAANKWNKIRAEWLDSYVNRKTKAGFSVMQKVAAEDEWCAEAYMETDYSDVTEDNFINEIKKYVLFKSMN